MLCALGAGIVGVSGAGRASASPSARRSQRPSASPRRDLARGTMADWQAHVGTRFALGAGASLRLVAVEPLCGGGPNPGRGECFAAVFEASDGRAPAGDAIYRLETAGASPLALHLGSRAGRRGRMRYVAVFN